MTAATKRAMPALLGFAFCFVCVGVSSCAKAPSATPPIPDVVFVPTPFQVVDQMLDVARVKSGDVLFDLGSGDGRIVIAAAKRFGIRATGIDIDPRRIAESRVNADTAGVSRLVEFREADLFATNLTSASVVTLYLLPALNVRLRPKLFAELKPGSRVVSHSFDMGDWRADSTLSVDTRIVYFWVVPADAAGDWALTAAIEGTEQRHNLNITQKYQDLTVAGTDSVVIENDSTTLRGDSIRFIIGESAFGGSIRRDSMQGWVTKGMDTVGIWRARKN